MKPEQALKHLLKWNSLLRDMFKTQSTKKIVAEINKCRDAVYFKNENEYYVYVSNCSAIVFYELVGDIVVEYRQYSRKADEDGEHEFVYSLRYDDENGLIGKNREFWEQCQWEFDMRGF